MKSFSKELRERFPEQVLSVEESVSGQVTVLLNNSDATAITRHDW
jgi:hypothetical protein